MMGGLEYTRNLQNLVTRYYFEVNYWNSFTRRRNSILPETKNSRKFSNTVPRGRQSHSPPPRFKNIGDMLELESSKFYRL